MRRRQVAFVAITLLPLLTAPAIAQQRPVVVASKIDTEGSILGHVILLALNANGIATENRIQLGATPVVRRALLSGAIDIYPEYTGNAAFFFNRQDDPAWRDLRGGYELARRLDSEANQLVWLAPAPANNTWAIAVRRDVAQANGLRTMSDFGRWVAAGGRLRLVASAEFVNSPTALPAFQTAYGFTTRPDQLIVLSGGDTAATIRAAAEQTNGANAAMVYGTDGGVEPSGLVVLEDDKAVQPVYAPAPVVRRAVLDEHPRLPEILEPIFARLDAPTLRRLNGRVQLGGEPARGVAEDWLRSEGLVRRR